MLFLHSQKHNLQLVLRIFDISENMQHKNTSQCKILVVSEEGWFGQPK